jgi:hypothetical protein
VAAILHRVRDAGSASRHRGGRLAVQTFVMAGLNLQHHSGSPELRHRRRGIRGQLPDELTGKPLDRALLACLAEQAGEGTPIAGLGCGPGHVAAWLTGRGVAAVGLDLARS